MDAATGEAYAAGQVYCAPTDPHLEALLRRQRRELPAALDELCVYQRALSRWAWWAFPTGNEDHCEPSPATALGCPAAAQALLRRAPLSWRNCLEAAVHFVAVVFLSICTIDGLPGFSAQESKTVFFSYIRAHILYISSPRLRLERPQTAGWPTYF